MKNSPILQIFQASNSIDLAAAIQGNEIYPEQNLKHGLSIGGAKFDPNNHKSCKQKILENILFILLKKYYYGNDSMNNEKTTAKYFF